MKSNVIEIRGLKYQWFDDNLIHGNHGTVYCCRGFVTRAADGIEALIRMHDDIKGRAGFVSLGVYPTRDEAKDAIVTGIRLGLDTAPMPTGINHIDCYVKETS